MDITKELQELDPELVRHNEGDWQNPFNSAKVGYSSFNDAGIEVETGEFLYAFARMLKPEHVLETGTHVGVGAAYLSHALKDNHFGHLDTIEFLPEIHAKAVERMYKIRTNEFVTCHLMDAKSWNPSVMYKLILLDTEPQTRFAEAIKFFENLESGGFMFIHDLHQHMHQVPNEEHGFAWPYGKIPPELASLVRYDKLRPFHFETPRGLTGFYKPHPGDYKWDKTA